jgi:aspartyl-tRNA(Asn)/glutamyl-tRNA(Gln) amidotransferase subunit B
MQYESVMGLEIHARLNTKTKMFCSCSNDTWKAVPNEKTCPICLAFPGTLPSINKEALYLGRRMGLALNCIVNKISKFDRKSYFYPDLPAGFQTSQFDEPICENGNLSVVIDGNIKKFRINRLHLENDAGKLTHLSKESLVDWNRSGSPLAEMVTEADFRTPKEVSSFLKELQRILRFLDISIADMEKGMMRCDVNVSVRPIGQEKFGTKVEMKNMNSFRNIEKALGYEIKRQISLYEEGNKNEIIQETRGYNAEKNITFSQRTKEEAMDYRYFPEPDLPIMTITEEEITKIKEDITELPFKKILRYIDNGVGYKEADALVQNKVFNEFFESLVKDTKNLKISANWMLGEISGYLNDNQNFSLTSVDSKNISSLINLVLTDKISGKIAKQIFPEIISDNKDPLKLIESKGLLQESNKDDIKNLCNKILSSNSALVEEYKNGKTKLFGSFVGQVMKESKGKANPKIVNEILKSLLS